LPGENSVTLTRDKVLEILQANREALSGMGVRRLALFGSMARNDGTEASDLDFLVEFERKSFDGYMNLKDFLESLFARHVDLVLADSLKPALRDKVLKEAVDASRL
jgi:uncharacterized protein